MEITITTANTLNTDEVIELYRANGWSSAGKPVQLMNALGNAHTLVTARAAGCLVGLGYAISDGHLVVYYSHLLVHPDFQGQGVGRGIMEIMLRKYAGFHQQVLTADCNAVEFFKRLGFKRAGRMEPMWIYAGNEH
jgi:GNAT superfamily N-acetyltransferase